MCGIIGVVAERDVAKILVAGLKRLEYRGYDSAGVVVINPKKELETLRTVGKVRELESQLEKNLIRGHMGIAHTRWATHGAPTLINAHPHVSHDEIAVVHNGIIENHDQLRIKLQQAGYQFQSQTDTEVIVHLIHHHLRESKNLLQAVQKTVAEVEGAYALGIIAKNAPGRMIAVRNGSPLVVGMGINENYIASDALALMPCGVDKVIYLEEGDIADIQRESVMVYDRQDNEVKRTIHTLEAGHDTADRGEYRHYMEKEIFEQPTAVATCLEGRVAKNHIFTEAFGPNAPQMLAKVQHIHLIACGTSYHAAMVARYWLEELTGVPCLVETASEYRYRKVAVLPNTLFVCLSQSGETADTLAALRMAKSMHYLATLAICNVSHSSLTREADFTFLTRAGAEIGVASTKAFTTQLVALFMLTISLAKSRGLSGAQEMALLTELRALPQVLTVVLKQSQRIQTWIAHLAYHEHALFLGRGPMYPIALEGALKLKELSYIHAEAYPAGELKHGPLALVDKNMPVIAIVPNDKLLDKIKSNLAEVHARGGKLFVLTDESAKIKDYLPGNYIELPAMDAVMAPILYTIPLQLLAYYVAVWKGTDVDQPRNLAKSVTVE